MEPIDFDDIRISIAEDLASLGKALGDIRQEVTDEIIEKLMPPYNRARFRRAVAESRAAILKAMDCLMPKESPSTEAVLEQLIYRWEKSDPKVKDAIMAALREAFKKQKDIPYGSTQQGNDKAPAGQGTHPKDQAKKP